MRTPLTSLRTNLDLLAQADQSVGGAGNLPAQARRELMTDVRAQIEELTTLVGSKPSSPWVDTAAFPGATPTKFWTSSEDHGSPGDAWALDFSAGAPRSVGSGLELDVRCVR